MSNHEHPNPFTLPSLLCYYQFENTSLHYLAQMDSKEAIDVLLQTLQILGKEHSFGQEVAKMSDSKNSRE